MRTNYKKLYETLWRLANDAVCEVDEKSADKLDNFLTENHPMRLSKRKPTDADERMEGRKGERMNWTKLPPLERKDINFGCACCSSVSQIAHMEMGIAVGFGSAFVTRDDELVHDGENESRHDREPWSVQDAENIAKGDPDHDWRITLFGPLHGEIYQRQGEGRWVLVESNQGFA